MLRKVSCLLLLMFVSVFASAEIYKWKDENGKTHFSSSPPSMNKAQALKLRQSKGVLGKPARSEQKSISASDTKSVESVSSATSQSEKDRKRCEKYKAIYEKYKREGVLGINPFTGHKEMMKGEAARTAIQNAKDNAEIFCN